MKEVKDISKVIAGGLSLTALVVVIWLGIGPIYRVWSAGMAGAAASMKARYERQILVTQAQAERDAAVMRAEAIKIVGSAAKEFPEYRQQEFIGAFADALRDGKMQQIIYVPTEANIPIIEAGRNLKITLP